jgi:hypothetical protein
LCISDLIPTIEVRLSSYSRSLQTFRLSLNYKTLLTGPSENSLGLLAISKETYRISSYSFRGNYSFLDFEILKLQYIRPKVTVHKGAETIQGRKLYEEIRYVTRELEQTVNLK